MLHSIAFLLIWIKGKGPTSSFLGLFIVQGPTSGRGHAVGPRLGWPWISWSRDYREDADSVQALASDWSTLITWPQCWPLIGRGWRMQMVTGGQTLGSLRLGVNTAGACLESQGRDPGPRMSPWGQATDRRLQILSSSPTSHPLPASGHTGAPAVAVVQQCTVHKLTKPISLHNKGGFFSFYSCFFRLYLECGKLCFGKAEMNGVSLFLEVSSLLSHWAVGMRQRDKIIFGPTFICFLTICPISGSSVNIPPMILFMLVKSSLRRHKIALQFFFSPQLLLQLFCLVNAY